MKKIFNILVILAILLGALYVTKNAIAKVLIEMGVEKVTGLPLKMKGIDVNLAGQFVQIDDMKIYNPSGFPNEQMVHIPEIYVAYNLGALIKGKIHLPELRFAMEEFAVVRNEEGELNLDKLRALGETPREGETTQPEKPPVEADIQIDSFTLKVGHVLFKDYTGPKPSVRKFDIQLAETFKNITDPNELVRLVVAKALMSTSIAAITGFDLGALQTSVSGLMNSSVKLAGNLANKSLEEIAAKTGGLKEVPVAGEIADAAGETAKEAASAVKNKASSLAGGLADKLKSL